MNKQRAIEIAKSPVMEDVTYNGDQIYIQHVNEQTNMANIHLLDDPGETLTVNVSHLEEND
ncbi:MAG TPA: H-type small acid-soluble spore protein [Bacillota bacterium]|nr:H-type small acid-soluble spore protein [Bacillota bacterium]